MAEWQEELERAREEARKVREEADRLRQEAKDFARRLRQEARDRSREERQRERDARSEERMGRRAAGWGPGGPDAGPEVGEGSRAEQSFSLDGVSSVHVDQTAGRLTIRPCAADETPGVISTGTKSAPRLEVNRDGDRLVIEIKLSTGWLFRRKQGATTLVRLSPRLQHLKVDLGYGEAHIREIEAESIRLGVGAGTISTAQTAGQLHANVGAGKLSIHGHSGLAECDTGTGDILVDISRLVEGEYKVDAGIGRAEVRIPEGERVHFRISSGIGKTRIEYPDAGDAATTVVRMNTGVGEASVRARKPTDSAPPAPPPATAKPQRGARGTGLRRRETEELRVLQLLEQGRITSQEAADLIAALHGAGAMPEGEDELDAGMTVEGEAELPGGEELPPEE